MQSSTSSHVPITKRRERVCLTLELIPDGTVTSPKGYVAGAVYAGIKTYGENKLILAAGVGAALRRGRRVHEEHGAGRARHRLRRRLAGGRARGIVVNAGCSNGTGDQSPTPRR
ncbi:MAG: hypothetical protein U0531_21375 [Dehalococcoidia bacterium]